MISVIIPVYNGERYLKKTIDSLLRECRFDKEIVIIDDGSIDKTRLIIGEYLEKWNNIKYFHIENSGQAFARNFGISKATGKYIALMDADDISRKDRFEKQVEFLEKNRDIDFVYNDIYIIDEDDNVVNEIKAEVVLSQKEDFYAYEIFRQMIPSPPSMMIRRGCFEKVKYPEEYRFAEDYKFILELSKRYKGGYINEPLYFYRRHEGNLTNKHKKQMEAEVSIVKEIGIKNIEKAILKTSFSRLEKDILFGKILLKIEETELALKKFLEIEFKDEYVLFYIANIFYEKEELIKAKEYYIKALEINDKLAEVYNNLGIVYYKLGKIEEANLSFDKAIEINSMYMDASYNKNATKNFKLTKRELRKK
ncbi:MAG: glycosyltransferase, partial [Clostridium sp.]